MCGAKFAARPSSFFETWLQAFCQNRSIKSLPRPPAKIPSWHNFDFSKMLNNLAAWSAALHSMHCNRNSTSTNYCAIFLICVSHNLATNIWQLIKLAHSHWGAILNLKRKKRSHHLTLKRNAWQTQHVSQIVWATNLRRNSFAFSATHFVPFIFPICSVRLYLDYCVLFFH